MGLVTGEHGVKNLVKSTCADSVREFDSLAAVVEATGCTEDEVVVLLDGNVLVRQVPMSVTDFKEYARIFERFVSNALDAAKYVIVVFDEPERITKAKVEEQLRRDVQSKKKQVPCSADLNELIPKTDDYTLAQMLALNPHDLMQHRGARNRLFDALCKRCMISLYGRLEAQEKTLVFDGVDSRGADRPMKVRRETAMFSNNDTIETLLRRSPSDAPVGEGDVKLTELECEIQFLRNTKQAFEGVQLVIVSTIDTDSIAIELMCQSARNQERTERPELPEPVTTLLCFREKSGKRGGVGDEAQKTVYSCVDIESAHKKLCQAIGAPAGYERHAIALLCGGWLLCGSDFVKMKGMRPDVVFLAMQKLCSDEENRVLILSKMKGAWTLSSKATEEERAKVRARLTKALSSLVTRVQSFLSVMPRMQRASASVQSATETCFYYSRAAFVLIYWNGLQLDNSQLHEWGFTLCLNSNGTPPPTAPIVPTVSADLAQTEAPSAPLAPLTPSPTSTRTVDLSWMTPAAVS